MQQTGFRREKRYGLPRNMDQLLAEKRNPWVSIKEALDQDENGNLFEEKDEFVVDADPRVVHDENFYNRMQHAASHK